MKLCRSTASAAVLCLAGMSGLANAGVDPYLGEVMLVGNPYCPQGWTEAAGQVLPIVQNTALFSLFGTQFGGDGQNTFALPDLRSRVPIGQGQGGGLSPYVVGQTGGGEQVTLSVQQMPAHTHTAQTTLSGTETDAATGSPGGALLGASGTNIYAPGGSNPDLPLAPSSAATTIGVAGGSQPVGIMNPYLGMRWCVALQGVYPPRN